MSTYDHCIDGDIEVQIKTFECDFNIYKPGDKIPVMDFGYPENFSIAIPSYSIESMAGLPKLEGPSGSPTEVFYVVVIVNSEFQFITNDRKLVVYPLYDKWGNLVEA